MSEIEKELGKVEGDAENTFAGRMFAGRRTHAREDARGEDEEKVSVGGSGRGVVAGVGG